jgi:hypothetical protein
VTVATADHVVFSSDSSIIGYIHLCWPFLEHEFIFFLITRMSIVTVVVLSSFMFAAWSILSTDQLFLLRNKKCVHLRGTFEDVVSTETAQRQLIQWDKNDRLIGTLTQNLSGGTEETHKNSQDNASPDGGSNRTPPVYSVTAIRNFAGWRALRRSGPTNGIEESTLQTSLKYQFTYRYRNRSFSQIVLVT